MGAFLSDFRYAVRMLVKHPGLAAISIIALALGLGLTTTMWSITYGGILRGLPFEEAENLVHMERARPNRDIESMGVPIHDYLVWKDAQTSFEDLAGWYEGTVNVSGIEGQPERFEGGFMTASTFRLIRVPPLLGRTFTDEDERVGGPPVVIVGWEVWQNRLGGDSAIVGKTLRANGVTAEIIGVMPRGFLFPTNTRLWLPLRIDASAVPWGQGSWLEVMGRLRPGVDMERAKREMETITARIGQDHPEENEGVVPILQPFTEEYVGKEPIIMLWTMMAAVFGVLLIACSNVANLLLARAAVRTKEVAIRTALGASRWRVVSQLLTESLVLALTGALIGMVIAWAGVRLFNNAIADTDPPFWIQIRLDGPVLAFVAGVTMLAALISGVVPALQATRQSVHDVLKDESRGSSSLRLGRFSRGLVVAELALSGGLLVAAGFMIQSVVQLSRFDYGTDVSGIFTARIGLFETTYPDTSSRDRFWRDLEQRLNELPGQQGVALMTVVPGLEGWSNSFAIEGATYEDDRNYPRTRYVAVTPGWFSTFDVQPLEGRVLTTADVRGSLPVALVSREFVNRFYDGQSPLGKRIRIGDSQSTEPWLTIVGVVPDVYYDGTSDEPMNRLVITPVAQGDYRFLSLAARATGEPMSLMRPVQSAITAIDPDQPMYFARSLQDTIKQNGWFYSVFGSLFMVFGAAALFLATVGVYGVMSFAVSRRTPEIGVRMALGAGANDVLRMFLRQGAAQVAIGLTLGLALAFFLSKGLTIVLFQVDTKNWMMYAGVSAALAITGLVATLIPARRATRVDPLIALRHE